MNRRKFRAVAAVILWVGVTGTPPIFGASVEIPAGYYQITTQTLLPNLEESLGYATTITKKCLSRQSAANFFPVMNHQSFVGCDLIRNPVDEGFTSFSLICRNSHAATGSALLNIGKQSFRATLNVKMGGKNMKFSQIVHAVRVRSCTPADLHQP